MTHHITFGVYATCVTPSSTKGGPPSSCPCPTFVWTKGVGIEMRTVRSTGSGGGGGGDSGEGSIVGDCSAMSG